MAQPNPLTKGVSEHISSTPIILPNSYKLYIY